MEPDRKDLYEQIVRLEEMLAYNIRKGAHTRTLAQIRREIKELQGLYENQMIEALEKWHSVYMEERRRGEPGGASESDANANAAMKQLMKDNRAQSTKMTVAQRKEYFEALRKWEEENGKLERLPFHRK